MYMWGRWCGGNRKNHTNNNTPNRVPVTDLIFSNPIILRCVLLHYLSLSLLHPQYLRRPLRTFRISAVQCRPHAEHSNIPNPFWPFCGGILYRNFNMSLAPIKLISLYKTMDRYNQSYQLLHTII